MTKEPTTREQLAEMILKEAHATGKCDDLHSVAVLGGNSRAFKLAYPYIFKRPEPHLGSV